MPPRLPLLIAAAALAAGCAATVAAPPDLVRRHSTPGEIIVPGRSTGAFRPEGGCIFFHYADRRHGRVAALFPPGALFSADRRTILLPNGDAIPLGARVSIALELPPNRPDVDRSCGPDPIEVLNLIDR